MWRRTTACGNRKTDVDKAAVPERRRENRKTARQGPDRRKNCLRFAKSCSTIRARRIKGGTWRAGTSPRPYAGDATSHTAEFLRHAHYTGNLPFLQGGKSRCGSVCCIGAVQGSLYPAQPFYSPQPELPAGDGTGPPGDPFGDPAAAWRKNPSCRQRTARGRSGLPDQMSGGFFSAVLPEKISKNIKPAASLPALNTRDPEKTKRRDEHEKD